MSNLILKIMEHKMAQQVVQIEFMNEILLNRVVVFLRL